MRYFREKYWLTFTVKFVCALVIFLNRNIKTQFLFYQKSKKKNFSGIKRYLRAKWIKVRSILRTKPGIQKIQLGPKQVLPIKIFLWIVKKKCLVCFCVCVKEATTLHARWPKQFLDMTFLYEFTGYLAFTCHLRKLIIAALSHHSPLKWIKFHH